MPPESDLGTLLRSMDPVLHGETYVFATVPDAQTLDPSILVASIREPEGLSVIVAENDAVLHGLPHSARCAWITLTVNSAIEAVGLTAAFSAALTDVGISCNVVAGANHDHLFVPVADAARAMNALRALQARAAA